MIHVHVLLPPNRFRRAYETITEFGILSHVYIVMMPFFLLLLFGVQNDDNRSKNTRKMCVRENMQMMMMMMVNKIIMYIKIDE